MRIDLEIGKQPKLLQRRGLEQLRVIDDDDGGFAEVVMIFFNRAFQRRHELPFEMHGFDRVEINVDMLRGVAVGEHGFRHRDADFISLKRLMGGEENFHGVDLARMKSLGIFAQRRGDQVNELRQGQAWFFGTGGGTDELLHLLLLLGVMLRRELLKRLDPRRCG